MKNPLRIIALSLWFAPIVICLIYSLFDGFTHENYGLAALIHNGLNPTVYAHEEIGVWISIVLSAVILAYVRFTPKRSSSDIALLVFVILSYVFAGVQFIHNFHPG